MGCQRLIDRPLHAGDCREVKDIFNVPETCLDDFAISYVTEGEVQLLILPQIFRLSSCPVARLSRTSTSKPCSMSPSTRWLPMKPAPPVTRIRLLMLLGSAQNSECSPSVKEPDGLTTLWAAAAGSVLAATDS